MRFTFYVFFFAIIKESCLQVLLLLKPEYIKITTFLLDSIAEKLIFCVFFTFLKNEVKKVLSARVSGQKRPWRYALFSPFFTQEIQAKCEKKHRLKKCSRIDPFQTVF